IPRRRFCEPEYARMIRMRNHDIDCLIVGNNQIDFAQYVRTIVKMGDRSGAVRDLNLSYYEENGVIYSCMDFYNKYFLRHGADRAMSYDDIFSATVAYLGTFLRKYDISFDYVNSFQEGKDYLRRVLREQRVRTVAVTTTYYVSVLPILD